MYEPPLHRQEDLAAQHALIRAHPLGLLISHGAERLAGQRDPVPDLSRGLEARHAAGACGARQSAMARSAERGGGAGRVPGRAALHHALLVRDQARDRQSGADLELCDRAGARAPARDRGRALAARADRGDDATSREARAPSPGRSATRRRISSPRRSAPIVGVEIEIADIKGKWKASQNRKAADRAGVVAGLEAEGDEDARDGCDREKFGSPAVDELAEPVRGMTPGSESRTDRPACRRARRARSRHDARLGITDRPARFVDGLAEPVRDMTPHWKSRTGRPRRGRLQGAAVDGLAEPVRDATPGGKSRTDRPQRGRLQGGRL